MASAATSSVSASANPLVGQSVGITSNFVAPNESGSFILDTEVYNSGGQRVAQFFDTVWMSANSTTSRSYSWNTSNLRAGVYSFRQGVFRSNWSRNLKWSSNAGSVCLSDAPAATYSANASVVNGSTASISSTFSAPANAHTAALQLMTDVYGPNGRVASWASQVTLVPSQSWTNKYSLNTTSLPAGSYAVKQFVFSSDWTKRYYEATGASFSVAAKNAAPVTTQPVAQQPAEQSPAANTNTDWALRASVEQGASAKITAVATIPTNTTTSNIQFDVEVYGRSGTRAAQWTEPIAIAGKQEVVRSFNWTPGTDGPYSVRMGVFSSDWSRNLKWNSTAASVDANVAAPTPPSAPLNSSKQAEQASVVEKPAPAPTTTVAPTTTAAPAPTTTTTAAPTTTTTQVRAQSSGNPLVAQNGFYANPNSQAAITARDWRTSRPGDAPTLQRLADGGAATWLGGWNSNVRGDVNTVVSSASSRGEMPVFVAYNIPNRDCGSYSGGGAGNAGNYHNWIDNIADGIGWRKAAVILEPDALAQLSCLSSGAQQERFAMLRDAVATLQQNSGAVVYIDAGHSNWIAPSTMADRLRSAGVGNARGFSLNVSNFMTTSSEVAFGQSISASLGGSHFIVDTSRNGNGPLGSQWCNPTGRKVGIEPTTRTGVASADAFIWVKQPGESDGNCNGGPSAGQFWAENALELARRAWE